MMTINTQKLREHAGNLKPPHLDVAIMLLGAADAYDAQSAEIAQARQTADYWKAEHNAANAEIARLRGLVAEMAEHDTYETEYDGRMYSICHGCGAQDGEPHRDPNCLYVRAQAALSGESHD